MHRMDRARHLDHQAAKACDAAIDDDRVQALDFRLKARKPSPFALTRMDVDHNDSFTPLVNNALTAAVNFRAAFIMMKDP